MREAAHSGLYLQPKRYWLSMQLAMEERAMSIIGIILMWI